MSFHAVFDPADEAGLQRLQGMVRESRRTSRCLDHLTNSPGEASLASLDCIGSQILRKTVPADQYNLVSIASGRVAAAASGLSS
jgi:hypothetical protein